MTPEEFRKYGHAVVDWIADYRARLESLPVMAKTQPGEVRALLPDSPPDEPESFDAILGDVDRVILPGLSLWQHPRFFGYFPANSSLASVLGDFLSTGLGVLGLAWQSSPALTEIEEVTTDWLRQMVGLSLSWSGVIQDTASTSTLVALMCAREQTTGYSLVRGGLQSEPRPLVVYVSAHSHSSVDKAALLAGFGRDNIHIVDHDGAFAMRPDALRQAIESDLAAGKTPCAIVATTGSTTTTAIDPIAPIAAIAKQFGLWLHVDAAMAGSAMILPECRWMWDGIEAADSIVLNPHKWLGAAFDSSVFYVRDPQHLIRVMSTNPSYLQTSADGQVKNYRDWGCRLVGAFEPSSCGSSFENRAWPDCRLVFAVISTTLNGWLNRLPQRRTGRCWPPWLFKPSACGMSPTALRAKLSIDIRSTGPMDSIAPVSPISLRPHWAAAGWCESPSAPNEQNASMWNSSGLQCGKLQ